MNQTRLGSLIEACINTALGFIISFVVWPVAGFIFSLSYNSYQHVGVVGFFTLVSVVRGYLVRRYANHAIHKMSGSIVGRILQ